MELIFDQNKNGVYSKDRKKMDGLDVLQSIETYVSGYRMTMQHQIVTPALASFWLENYDYEGQRRLRESNLRFLEKEMSNNRFLPNSMMMFWVEKGVAKLVDGRHRLNAIVRTGQPGYFWVQTIYSDSSTIGIVYSVVDVGSIRTAPDGLRALATDIPQAWLGKTSIVGGVRRVEESFGFARNKPTALELDQMIAEWSDALNLYGESVRGGSLSKYMRSSRLIAAGLITCRWQPVLAQQFWNGIAYDDGLRQDDPRKYIAKNIVDPNHVLRHLGQRYEKTAGQTLAYVWNKFHKGAPLTRFNPPSADAPIAFDGTPYDTALPNNGIPLA